MHVTRSITCCSVNLICVYNIYTYLSFRAINAFIIEYDYVSILQYYVQLTNICIFVHLKRILIFVSLSFANQREVTQSAISLEGSTEIHMARSDKVQTTGEQAEHIDVPLQNGGTKTQEENPEPSKY